MMRLQAVMVKFGAAMIEVRRARGDLGLGDVGGRDEGPQCAECGSIKAYIPRGGGGRNEDVCRLSQETAEDGSSGTMHDVWGRNRRRGVV